MLLFRRAGKTMHSLYPLSAKVRVRTGTISVCIKASLTNKLSEINNAYIDYTPPSPILMTYVAITIISSHFGCQNRLFWEVCTSKLRMFVSLIAMCPSLRSLLYFTTLTILVDVTTLRIPHYRK